MNENTMKHIDFENRTNPKSFFDIVQLEELLDRKLDHDVCKNHMVKFYIIFFVVAGEGQHTIDFTTYTYQKGSVLLIRKDQVQRFFKTNTKGYLLVFTEDFIVSHLNRLEASKSFQLFNDLLSFPKIVLNSDEEYTSFITLIEQITQEYRLKDEYSIGITRSVLHIIITKLFRIKADNGLLQGKKKYLEEFLLFQTEVEKRCFESKKVKDYATEMGVSTKTLNTIVQAIVNKPAKTFIDEVAITQIKRLLIGTAQPIKEIAYSAGFDNPANFFKYFKKYVGTSPEAFRQAHQ